jgi:uncharacterized protein (DUF2062 family)
MQKSVSIKKFLQNKLVRPILGFLNQGVTPNKLALTVALGIIIGLLPIFGVASIICALIAFSLRLNMAAIQLAHYAAAPLQLILLVPFIRIGGVLFNQPPMNFSFGQLYQMFTTDLLATLQNLWFTFFLGFLGWTIVSIPLAFVLYYGTLPVFRKFSAGQLKRVEPEIIPAPVHCPPLS